MEQRPPLHLGVVAVEKRAFWLPSTKVVNFTYFNFNVNLIVNFTYLLIILLKIFNKMISIR